MADTTMSRPELRAHEHAMRQPFEQVVRELRDVLTPRLVAYLASVRERVPFTSGLMAAETSSPARSRTGCASPSRSLCCWRNVTRRAVVQAWFQGLNPHLDDRSPARLLREGDLAEVGPPVLAAARAFQVGG